MNFMGMGIPEVGVILLVAFLVLGPGRSIDMARNAGKMLGDLRRSFSDVTSALTIEDQDQRGASQPGSQEREMEPPPGVPMRAETPPDDDEEGGSGGTNPGLEDKAGPEDKG